MASMQAFTPRATVPVGAPTTSATIASVRSSGSSFVRGSAVLTRRTQGAAASRGVLTIVAKQNTLKRQKTSERDRLYNKARKSEIKTRTKKVLTLCEQATASGDASQLDTIEKYISEAFKTIDKAKKTGVLKANTADRRKARLSRAKTRMLVASGLYTPKDDAEAAELAAPEAPEEDDE
mmetsp:Transcript_11987/g.43778  ORF Transcript_11987/g.43778 Transcript_11987/m.43778 type:complete len:179 (-) Transcript_11987:334-870(-)|eukprot:scaffold2126_cov417-Prasinococcus_capsulatus_cf.AAC.7